MKKFLKISVVLIAAIFILILVLGYFSLDESGYQQPNTSEDSVKSNSRPQSEDSVKSNSRPQIADEPKVLLTCKSKTNNSSASLLVALFNTEADVIYSDQNGRIWGDGSALNLTLDVTDFTFKITHPYFNNKFSINRTSLELIVSRRTKSIFTGEDDSIFNTYLCIVDPNASYTNALEKYTSHVENLRLKEQKELNDLKANRKI